MYLLQARDFSSKRKVIPLKVWLWCCTVSATAISIATYLLTARTMGPHTFGIYVFVQWLATCALPLIGVGTSLLTSQRIADIQSQETLPLAAGIFYFLWNRQCHSIIYYCLLYLLLAYPLYWLFTICHPMLLLLAGLSTLPLLLGSIASVTLRSLHRADLLATLHLVGAIALLLFALLAIQINRELVSTFLLASALAGTLTLLLALFNIMRLLPAQIACPPGIFLKERLLHNCSSTPLLFLCDAIVWQRCALLFLVYWHTPAEAGFYAISSLISALVIEIAPTLLANWLYLLHKMRPAKRYDITAYGAFVKTSCLLALLAIPICILIMVFCPTIVLYCFGANYLPLVSPLRILLIPAIFGSIATVSLTHLAAHTPQKAQARLGMGCALLNIVLALPLVALWGLNGAAIASAIAQTGSAIGSILLCARLLRRLQQWSVSNTPAIPLLQEPIIQK